MNIQTQILNTLTSAKAYAVTWDLQIITNIKNGIDVCCEEEKITLYTIWIEILQTYYNQTYGGAQYYGFRYINEDQAILLMARINSRDFKKQTLLSWSPEGDYNDDHNNDFLIS